MSSMIFMIVMILTFLIYNGIIRFSRTNPIEIYPKNLKLRYYVSYAAWLQIFVFTLLNMLLDTKPDKTTFALSISISIIGLISLLYCIHKMAVLAHKYFYNKGELDKSLYWSSRADRAKLEFKVMCIFAFILLLTIVHFIIKR